MYYIMFIDYAAGNTVSLSASFSFDLALFSRCLAVKRPLDLLGHTRQRTSMPPDATNPSVRFVYFPLSTLLLLTKQAQYVSVDIFSLRTGRCDAYTVLGIP